MRLLRDVKFWVVLLTLACFIYAGFALWRAWAVFQSGDLTVQLLAGAIVIIPVLGCLLVLRELRFGMVMQSMGRQLALEGGLPERDFARDSSGRVNQDLADAYFSTLSHLNDSTNWRDWYLIAMAYEDCRDRKRARRSMRTAEKLFRIEPTL